MSHGSERLYLLRKTPRLILFLTGWVFLSLVLRDTVTPLWVWTAFPAAAILGVLPYKLKLKILPSLLFIFAVPWLIRFILYGISLFNASPLVVTFDNGWFLTAPYLYMFSVSCYMALKRRVSGFLETYITAGLIVALVNYGKLWPETLSGPAADSLNLLVSVFVVLLSALSFAGLRRDEELRDSGSAQEPGGKSPVAGRLFYLSVLTAALVLLVIGGNRIRREQSIQSGGGLLASELFRFDFSDVLSLEPEISLNAEITMLYRENGPATLRYLRRYTLSGWDNAKGFYRDGDNESDLTGSDHTGVPVPIPVSLPRSPRQWPAGDFLSRTEIDQEYYIIALDPESFFSLSYPVSVEPWTIWDNASFSRAYASVSMVSVAGPWELMEIGEVDLEKHPGEYYLRGGDDPYFVELAEEITGDYEDRWSRVSAVERWFHDNFYYSLKPGLAPDGNQLNWFLQQTQRGYCSYFAFAMTRICRAAGIPARVAVGFLTDPETSTLGFVPVRSDQAHAWVEVWFDDYGWITFDPTSSVMAPGEDYPFQFLSPDDWLPLIEEVLTRSGEVSIAMDEGITESGEQRTLWTRVIDLAFRRPWILITAAAAALLTLYIPRRLLPGAVRYMYARSSRPRRSCLGLWRLFAGTLSRAGYRPYEDETVLGWAKRVEQAGLTGFTEWTGMYLKAEYSPHFDAGDLSLAIELGLPVKQKWRRLPLHRRLSARFGTGWRGGFPW